eukprot:2155295-Prymnesium_polylepis.1
MATAAFSDAQLLAEEIEEGSTRDGSSMRDGSSTRNEASTSNAQMPATDNGGMKRPRDQQK